MKRQFYTQPFFAISFITAMAMVAVEVSAWIAIFSFFLLLWKWGSERLNWKALGRKPSGILSALLLVQVLFQYRTLVGQEPSYTFLLGLSALRVMDYENDRDHKFVVLLGFVLIAVKALFSIDIYWMIPSGFAFAGLWYALLPNKLPAKNLVLIKLFILSVPLTAILFFAFPRVVLPWAMSRANPSSGQIGFSDDLNPGSVASIAGNPNTAFRAKLTDLPTLKTQELYWRGSVLTRSRGLSWTPDRPAMRLAETSGTNLKSYEVAIEPTSQVYLFTLDGSREVQLESGGVYTFDNSVFRATRPLVGSAAYRVFWDPAWKDTVPPREEHTQVPKLQGRVGDWVEQAKESAKTPGQKLEKLKDLFSDGEFAYTLSPGFYAPTDLEVFLFERKRGFCEHFSGAYATLARALGIPARVVIGYHGGRYNPLGDFWRIGQRDAHAWVEIYNEGVWQRVDPTTWVAPLRLVIGAEEFFNLSEEDQRTFARNVDWRPNTENRIAVWDQVTFWFEDINYRWSYFLIDFDRSSQQSFWDELGKFRGEVFVVLVFILAGCVYIFRSIFNNKGLISEELVLLRAIETWGEKRKITRREDEPPLTYIKKLQENLPAQKDLLNRAFRFYDNKAYAGTTPEESVKDLIRDFKYRAGEGH